MNIGKLLLAIWLIASGLLAIVDIRIPGIEFIIAALAIAAGISLAFELRQGKVSHNLGMLLLCIWLILSGIEIFLPLHILSEPLLAALAIAAGILLLLKK